MILTIGVAVVSFAVGTKYGATLIKRAETAAIAAVTDAKAALSNLLTKAQADAKAEVERLEAVAKKYL